MTRGEQQRLLEVLTRFVRHLEGLRVSAETVTEILKLMRTEEELVKTK